MEANFALDANAGSASPKGWQAAAKRGLIANNPFSRSKKDKPPTKVVFFFYIVIWTRTREEGATNQQDARPLSLTKKFHFFRLSPLYNYIFYFYIWAVLAGIAQLVEHDLAKVGVEGPSPFSRSKTKSLASS